MSVRSRRLVATFALLGAVTLGGCSSAPEGTGGTTAVATSTTSSPPPATSTVSAPPAGAAPPSSSSPRPTPKISTRSVAPTTSPAMPKSSTTPSTTSKARPARLPLDLSTGDATQVITVVSDRGPDTRASVQRWRTSGSGWRKVGSEVRAYVGADGIGKASESTSRTPAGSFTLTQAFGRDADPGTRLPYLRTTGDDYWISSPGAKYNTEQRCGSCGYDNGVNERLHDVTPEYDHAVVIDYNTRNAPGGVKQGRGSAFFLHIAAGEPTAGCVAIPRDDLVDVMTWLRPADHPRILIGVG